MKLRIGVHYDLRRSTAAAEPDLAALTQHAVAVEAAGGDVAWVAERPTEPDAWVAAALPVCAAMAAVTDRLRLGTAVLPLLLHHPLRVAEDAATLDALSGGRFELGVGLGGDPAALSGFGIEGEERAGRLDEALELVRAAWRGPLAFEGRHFQAVGVEVAPRPVQPGGPPIWVGASAPAAQRRAARLADGLILAPGASPTPFLAAWADMGRSASEARLAVLLPEAALRDPVSVTERIASDLRVEAQAGQLDLVLPMTDAAGGFEAALEAIRLLRAEHPDSSWRL